MPQIVGRALELLEAVVAAPEPLGLMEIVESTGVDKSTASRTLAFLVERGSLTRDASNKRFGLGPRTFALAASIGARNDIRVVAGPHLEDLRERTGESVSLHIRVGNRRVCVDGRESTQPVRRVIPLGESLPIHLGPSGKVILAHLPGDETDRLLEAAALSPGEQQHIRTDLASARRHGYLHTESDRTVGIRAVSAPIFDAFGVAASLTVAGPSERWKAADGELAAELTVAAAQTVSTNLGGRR